MHGAGGGLGAKQISRSHLHGSGAERDGRAHAARVGDTAGGDHRHLHRARHLRHQRESADLCAQVLGQEDAAMAARFHTLGDDRVHAVRFEPKGFLDGGCRREDFRAPGAHPIEQPGGRQAEVEADERGLEFLQGVGSLGGERGAAGPFRNRIRIDAVLAVVRGKRRAPRCFAPRVGHGRPVGEEVRVVRPVGRRADRGKLLAHRLDAQHRARQRTEAASLTDRDGKRRALHAGHRRLNDRPAGAEQVHAASVD